MSVCRRIVEEQAGDPDEPVCGCEPGTCSIGMLPRQKAVILEPVRDEVTEEGWGNGAYISNGEFHVPIPEGDLGRLMTWWLNTALEDFNKTVPKALEYGGSTKDGSADLIDIGEGLALLLSWEDVDTAIKQELGTWFYAKGKL